MSKILNTRDASEGTIFETLERDYLVTQEVETGKYIVEAYLKEGETPDTLGFVPESDNMFYLDTVETYELALELIEKQYTTQYVGIWTQENEPDIEFLYAYEKGKLVQQNKIEGAENWAECPPNSFDNLEDFKSYWDLWEEK